MYGKNKTKKPVSAPNTGKFAPKTAPVKNTADKEQRITKPPKPNKETEIWVQKKKKKCVYTSDMEEYISNDVQYKASCDNPKTELYHWFKKLKKDDANFVKITGDNHANLEFTDFEILPHKYNDNTYVFYMAKCPGGRVSYKYGHGSAIDHTIYTFKTGSNDTYGNNTIVRRRQKWLERKVDKGYKYGSYELPDYGHLFATSDNKGRKIVIFKASHKTPNTLDADKRGSDATFVLRSLDNKFTNLQKDLIRIFSDPGNQKYVTGENAWPLQTMVDYADGIMPLQNKTAFLSEIQSWAQHSKEADVNKIISDSNGFLELHLV